MAQPEPSSGGRTGAARPTFEVVNVGGEPVRILSVRTTCGCASAAAEPLLVPPGGASAVAVSMDPLEVGVRAAMITLETDSPTTPVVRFQLTEEGYRRPPYVFQVDGELFYREGYSRDDAREVVVDVIALKVTPATPPLVTSDLPFLRLDPPSVGERGHVTDPDLVVRTYRFPVRFGADPPVEAFSGQVFVADPWVPGRVLRRGVNGEANRPIRAVPARLVLDVAGTGDARSSARLLARSVRNRRPLMARTEAEDSPLVVEAIGAVGEDEDGFRAFEVRWRPGREIAEGIYNIIVRPEPAGEESLTVPVLVRRREG